MSDKHLERKEILNLVYTRQADRMADAYARLMADFSQMTAWGRGLESDLSCARSELMQVNADVELWKLRSDNWQKFCQLTRPEMTDELNRLKAEVERLQSIHSIDSIGIKQLKSEVERLTFDPLTYLDDKGEWMPRHTHLAAVERLKAQVERLTKAGDALENWIAWECESPAGTAEGYRDAWNAAKEGKQP